MIKYEPPHEVKDNEKLDSMIRVLESGESLPPVIVFGDKAFSGSHRLAAYESLEMTPEVIEIEDEDYKRVMIELGLDPIYDDVTRFSEFEDKLIELGLI